MTHDDFEEGASSNLWCRSAGTGAQADRIHSPSVLVHKRVVKAPSSPHSPFPSWRGGRLNPSDPEKPSGALLFTLLPEGEGTGMRAKTRSMLICSATSPSRKKSEMTTNTITDRKKSGVERYQTPLCDSTLFASIVLQKSQTGTGT